jgi:hypothetical protein
MNSTKLYEYWLLVKLIVSFILKIFFYGIKVMYMEKMFLTCFRIMGFFLDVGRKIIENPNAHTIHSLLIYSIVRCWLIKVFNMSRLC